MHQLPSNTITAMPPVLDRLRHDIDLIDDQILDLLERRHAIVRRIGWAKGSAAEPALAMRPAREADILARLTARAAQLPADDIAQIWRAVFASSTRQQRPYRLFLAGPASARAALATVAARRHSATAIEWADDTAAALAAARRGEAILLIPPDHELALNADLEFLGQHSTGCTEHPWALEIGRLCLEERPRPTWSRVSWRRKVHRQAPAYPEPHVLAEVERELAAGAPIVPPEEIAELQTLIGEVQSGRAMVIQAGDCAEPIDASGEEIGAMAALIHSLAQQLEEAVNLPTVRIGRIGGQFAKPRSRTVDDDGTDAISAYCGDAVNGRGLCRQDRTPDPRRLLTARDQARRVGGWLGTQFRPRLFTSHEALLLNYEAALTRGPDDAAWASSAHSLWLGERTRQRDGAHVEFLRGVGNPIGIKCGPAMTPDELRALLDRLDPGRRPGRLMLVARLSHRRVAELLPPLMKAAAESGHELTWLCDPMHGNNRTARGVKCRLLPEVIAEARAFVRVARAADVHPGGLHLEVSPTPVHECVEQLAQATPARRFDSLCDPRLNPEQARRVVAAFSAAMVAK